jgi:DNA-binding NarL/FixJ family response regulator
VSAPELIGRARELSAIERSLERASDGLGGIALVGEPGIGKSALWAEGVRLAERRGMAVFSARPVDAEAGLAYAALADLLDAVPREALGGLPEPQRAALDATLLDVAPPAGGIDERAVCAGVLSLLRSLAAERALVIAIDDYQWLDSPSARAVAFVARRLRSEAVALLLTCRSGPALDGGVFSALAPGSLEQVPVGPLSVAGLHHLFKLRLGRSFPRTTLIRIAAVSAGNPFYALEIARALEPGTGDGAQLPMPDSLSRVVEARLERLPEATRQALLIAACLAAPTVASVDADALAEAEREGIVVIAGTRVRFAHPLYAAAVYRLAGDARRRTAHRTLAEAVAEPEERARHLALACAAPDAAAAAELEAAASAAAARGAPSVSAELLELAVGLTPDDDVEARLRRTLALGDRLFECGSTGHARRALEAAVQQAPAGGARSEALFRLGWVVQAEGDWLAGAELLEEALVAAEDPRLVGQIHALLADIHRTDPPRAIAHAEQALALLDETTDPGVHANLLQHLAEVKLLCGQGADHALIERSLPLQRQTNVWELTQLGAAWARGFDDFETARDRFEELIASYEERGIEPELPSALAHLATIELLAGRWERCEALALESLELSEQIEQPISGCLARYPLAGLLAHRGRTDEARELVAATLELIAGQPEQILRAQALAVLGFIELSLERAEPALEALEAADAELESIGWHEPFHYRFYGDQVEAAVALGALERAHALVERLEGSAARVPRPWIRVVAARGRALLLAPDDPAGAVEAIERALEAHASLDMPFERARTLLIAGQIHRRHKHKRLAAEALGAALDAFVALDAPLWAARARTELARTRTRRAPDTLTPTELAIARLAAEGLTNGLIAQRVFVSPKTVEANLGRVYRKLGIAGRAQLDRALADRRD